MRYLITLLLFVCSNVFALDILIYHNNFAYTDSKSGLEGQGHTVTGSTSTTVDSASTLANYDVVFDQLYNNNCGSTCRSNYDTYVKDGGTLVIVGENSSFSGRNSNIESLIENKFGGTLDLGSNVSGGSYYSGGSNNTVNTSISGADDGGQYIYGSSIASTSDGTWVAKTSGGAIIWMMWRGSSLPSGYTGSVIVTFDINQFYSVYDSDATWEFFDDVVYYGINGSMQSSSPTTTTTTGTSLGPTSTQATIKSSAQTRRDSYSGDDNGIYIDQAGNNNSITILQDSDNNQIRGIDQQRAKMWGNSNIYDIRQGAPTTTGINLIELMVDGNSNDLDLFQDRFNDGTADSSASGDNILRIDIDGNSNTVATNQRGETNAGGQFGEIIITGDSNTVDLMQRSTLGETAFIDITGDQNVVDLLQQNTSNAVGSSKFADIKLTGDGHTVNLTQDGTGGHQATIDLTYGSASSTLNLNQLGSTSQSFSIEQTCYTVGGCSTTLTQQ